MDTTEAKRIIASYLTGHQRVTREELNQACESIKSDEVYLLYLRQELGLGDDWVILCDAFAERAAEFCEMSDEERRDEMPDLLEHLGTCGSCRGLYWEISPLWREQAAATARSFTRELSERIRLLIDKAGRMREQGLGPPPIYLPQVVPTLSPSEEGLPELAGAEKRKEWSLIDEAADCELKITIEGQAGRGAKVSCWIQPGPSQRISAERTSIEVCDAATGSLLLAGKLSDIEVEPIYLAPGSWLIHLLTEGREGSFDWRIPLELSAEE